MYLSQIWQEKSFKENVRDMILTPTGYLYEEPMLLMRQEVQEPGVYYALIEAIANGAVRCNEIALKIGEPPAKCLKYISVLRELGIVYKETPFGEKASSRKTQYGISDLMFRFWYRYVSPNKTLLETDAQEIVWNRRIAPTYSQYMGSVFEMVCRDYLLHQNAKGNLPILATGVGRWWGTDAKKRQQVEIDLIAQDGNDYLICECKWKQERLDLAILQGLREKAEVFSKHREHTWFVLFSKSGFTDAVVQEAQQNQDVILVGLEEIMA